MSKKQMFSIQLKGASPNKLFNEIEIGDNFKKLTHTLQLNYSKAPYFYEVMLVLLDIFAFEDKNLVRFLLNSYQKVFDYLNVNTKFILSSSVEKDNSLKGKEKVIDICHSLGAENYINAIGGQDLYDKKEFANNGINLYFLKTDSVQYPQFGDKFEPNLSFIDVLMFNGKDNTRDYLNQFSLI